MGGLSLAMMDAGFDGHEFSQPPHDEKKAKDSFNRESGAQTTEIQMPRTQSGGPRFASRSDGMEAGIVKTGIVRRTL